MSSPSALYAPSRSSPLCESIVFVDSGSHTCQTAQYLNDLRSPTLTRPSGSRPAPPSRFGSIVKRDGVDIVPNAAQASNGRPDLPTSNSAPNMPVTRLLHRRAESDLTGLASRKTQAGRPLVQAPPSSTAEPAQYRPVVRRKTSMTYMENGMRWMEKQEARSLRQALEDMDLKEETRIHAAAQDEAAELVWKHQNPDAARIKAEAPFANPDLKRDYRSHLRKGSYQRSHSQDTISTSGQRSASDSSQRSVPDDAMPSMVVSQAPARKASIPASTVLMPKTRSISGKSHEELSTAVAQDVANAHRRTSSGSNRILSGSKKYAMRPGDRIWEDPQEEATPPKRTTMPRATEPLPEAPALPTYMRRNPFTRVRMQHDRMERANSAPALPTAPLLPTAPEANKTTKFHRVEIQKNAPSQSRDPWYVSNEPLTPTPPTTTDGDAEDAISKTTPGSAEKEMRSEDIRAATSKQRKEYSPNLPRPTMVSDKPGRSIVSFDKTAGAKEVVLKEVHSAPEDGAFQRQGGGLNSKRSTNMPQIQVGDIEAPTIPTINLPPDAPTIPTIVLPEEPDFASLNMRSEPATPMINVGLPSFNISGPEETTPPRSKIPQRPSPSSRPLPHHAATAPLPNTRSTPHYTPSIRQSGVLCAHCALPIAGRILSAAGDRFHPGCFVCHQCDTNLELVAFYPEPERQRDERLTRIHARQTGTTLPPAADMTAEAEMQQEMDDGDASPRFYCHLDFHELFSPRCKSCKTPIEGEVIVACGAEWHAGHFFCAQCGDPFDARTPFVEKDGYAWCVGCHTNRYSSKCRKCRKPVTDVVVKALGSDWHGGCFVCMVSDM